MLESTQSIRTKEETVDEKTRARLQAIIDQEIRLANIFEDLSSQVSSELLEEGVNACQTIVLNLEEIGDAWHLFFPEEIAASASYLESASKSVEKFERYLQRPQDDPDIYQQFTEPDIKLLLIKSAIIMREAARRQTLIIDPA